MMKLLLRHISLIKEFPEEMLYSGMLAEIYKERGDNQKAQ